jgi:hypothetical protein
MAHRLARRSRDGREEIGFIEQIRTVSFSLGVQAEGCVSGGAGARRGGAGGLGGSRFVRFEGFDVERLGGMDGDFAVKVGGCEDGGVAGAPVNLEGPVCAGVEFTWKGITVK